MWGDASKPAIYAILDMSNDRPGTSIPLVRSFTIDCLAVYIGSTHQDDSLLGCLEGRGQFKWYWSSNFGGISKRSELTAIHGDISLIKDDAFTPALPSGKAVGNFVIPHFLLKKPGLAVWAF